MQYFSKTTKHWFFAAAMLLVLLTSACAGTAKASDSNNPASNAPAAANDTLVRGADPQLGEPTVRFALKTGLIEGKMSFIGVGGDLDGKINPDLAVQPGDVVEITLTIGDGMLHDWAAPDFGVATEQISETGQQTVVTFKADQEGAFAYYCTVPGHRQAGMEGRLIVGSGAASAPAPAGADVSIVRLPDDLPGPLNRSTPETVRVDLETTEVEARLADRTQHRAGGCRSLQHLLLRLSGAAGQRCHGCGEVTFLMRMIPKSGPGFSRTNQLVCSEIMRRNLK